MNNLTGLYRATVQHRRVSDAQIVVFFEVPLIKRHMAADLLRATLACIWNCELDHLQVLTLDRERDLVERPGVSDDIELFVLDEWHASPVYAQPEETLMLVSPPLLRRLHAAQARLPIVVPTAPAPLAAA